MSYFIERQIPTPHYAARTIHRVFLRVAKCSRRSTAEAVLKGVMVDYPDAICRIREVRT